MALKSILDIDINDEKFKAFQATFAKYADAVKKLPRAWGRVNAAQTESLGTVSDVTEEIRTQNALLQDNERAAERANRINRNNAVQWRDMARSAKAAAGSVLDAAKTAIRWSGATGLLGAGGLFGMDRMAESVSAKFRNAQGLGLSTGQMKGFGLGLSQLVDPESFLANINSLRHNIEGMRPLFAAGARDLSPGRDNATIAMEVIRGLKDQADQYKGSPQILQTMMNATGTGQIVGLEDMVRLQSMSRKEFEEFLKLVERTQRAAELSEETQKAWRDLKLTLDEAGLRIGAVFIRGLSGLSSPLAKLSDRVVGIVEAFAKSGGFERLIDDVGKGLETFAEWIGDGKFKEDAKAFGNAVGDIADATVALAAGLKWLADKLGHTSGGAGTRSNMSVGWEAMLRNPWRPDRWIGNVMDIRQREAQANFAAANPQATPAEIEAFRRQLKGGSPAAPGGSPAGRTSKDQVLSLIESLETGGMRNPDRAVSSAGALGRYQIMPDTARGLGYQPHDMFDGSKSKAAASKLLDELKATFKGDLSAMLLAYHSGPKVAQDWLAGGRNNDTLGPRAREYLERAAAKIAAGAKVDVRIDNRTGNDITTQTRTAAVQ